MITAITIRLRTAQGRFNGGAWRGSNESLISVTPKFMEELNVLEERSKGCVRIRMYSYKTDAGELRYAVEVVARNSWTDQEKLMEFTAGFGREKTKELFDALVNGIATYDWMKGDFVLEPGAM